MENHSSDIRRLIDVIGQCSDAESALISINQLKEAILITPLSTSHLEPFSSCALVNFLKKYKGHKAFDKSRDEVLTLLSKFIEREAKRRKNDLEQHYFIKLALDLLELCTLFWKNVKKESARVQSAALSLIISIIDSIGKRELIIGTNIVTLYLELLKNSEVLSYQPSVRGKMFHLLGVLTQKFGNDIFDGNEMKINQLFNHFMKTIEQQVSSENISLQAALLLGSIRGIDLFISGSKSILISNSFSRDRLHSLFTKIEQIVNPSISIAHSPSDGYLKINRREFQRAALTIIINHGDIFKDLLFASFKRWFFDILTWARSQNIEDSHVGRSLMAIYLLIICGKIKENELTNQNEAQTIIRFLTSEYEKILDKKESTKTDLTIAILGIGTILSEINVEIQIRENLINKIFMQIDFLIGELKNFEFGSYHPFLSNIGVYMDCLSKLIPSMQKENNSKNEARLLTIQKICILFTKYYPNLHRNAKDSTLKLCTKILQNVHIYHHPTFGEFIKKIINENLMHMISCQILSRENFEISNKEIRGQAYSSRERRKFIVNSYSYFHMWSNLIKFIDQDVPDSNLAQLIYDEILSWSLNKMSKFDFKKSSSCELNEDENLSSQDLISDDFQNSNSPKPDAEDEFLHFENLVNFLEHLIKNTKSNYLSKWTLVLITDLFKFISDSPSTTGFYKVLISMFNAFKENDPNIFFEDEESHGKAIEECQKLLNFLGVKLFEFRNDAQLCVLNVWLSAPDELISKLKIHLKNLLSIVFEIGRNNSQLASNGLNSLKKWLQLECIDVQFKETLYCELFPIFIEYLISNHASKYEIEQLFQNFHQLFNDEKVKEVEDRRFNFRLDSTRNILDYNLPLQDIGQMIYLDEFLPRIIKLCSSGNERQVKIQAAESFHSIILYFLGKFNKNEERSVNKASCELFQFLFSESMKLGSSSDFILKKLFNPLVTQIIHLYSTSKVFTQLMAQIIIEGMIQTENSSLKDFSKICIEEYFEWSLKNYDFDSDGVDFLVKKIADLAKEESINYRQAGFDAFTCIFPLFSQNESLIHKFYLLLLPSFIQSLCSESYHGKESNVIQSTIKSIRQLEKLIQIRKQSFNFTNATTKIIHSDFLNGDTMADLITWIFTKCSNSCNDFGREECLKLVSTLSVSDKGASDVGTFFLAIEAKNGLHDFLENMIESGIEDNLKNGKNSLESAIDAYCDIFYFILNVTECKPLFEKIVKISQEKETGFYKNISEFLSTKHETKLKISSKSYGKLGAIISNSKFQNSFKISFLVSSIRASLNFSTLNDDLISSWNTLWDQIQNVENSENFQIKIKTEALDAFILLKENINQNELIEKSIEIEVNWMTNLNLSSFMHKLLRKEDLVLISSNIWKFIMLKLYIIGKNNRIESYRLSSSSEKLLKKCLKLILHLNPAQGSEVMDAFLCSKEAVFVEGSLEDRTTKGEIFSNTLLQSLVYCPKIFEFKNLASCMKLQRLGMLILHISQIIKISKEHKNKFGAVIIEKTLEIWEQLHLNLDFDILVKILASFQGINHQYCENSYEFCTWVISQLTSRQKSIDEKFSLIPLFSVYGKSSNINLQNSIIESLDKIVQSVEEDKNNKIEFLLEIYEFSLEIFKNNFNNITLLRSLVSTFLKISNLIECEVITHNELFEKPLFSKLIAKTMDFFSSFTQESDEKFEVLNPDFILNNLFELSIHNEEELSLFVSKYFLIPLISSQGENVAEKFFKTHICKIIELSETASNLKADLIRKTIGFNLIETLAYKLTRNFIEVKLHEIYIEELKSKKDKDGDVTLLKAAISSCVAFKTQNFVPEESDLKLRNFQYGCHGAAYNALSALLHLFQKEDKFFLTFLLSDKPKRTLWDKLIDTKIKYSPSNLQENFEISKTQLHQETNFAQDIEEDDLISNAGSGIEAAQFDFTLQRSSRNFSKNDVEKTESFEHKSAGNFEKSFVINSHEVMLSVIGAIKKVFRDKTLDEGKKNLIDVLKSKLSSPETSHQNYKIFFGTLILKCEKEFRPMCHQLIEPLMNALISGSFKTEGESSLNIFEKQVLTLVLKWTNFGKPSVQKAEEVFCYIFSRLSPNINDDFKKTFIFLPEIVGRWMGGKFTPKSESTLLNSFKNIGDKTASLILTINFLNLKILPCCIQNISLIFDAVGSIISNSSKNQYKLASETASQLFRYLKEDGFPELENTMLIFQSKYVTPQKSRTLPFTGILFSFIQNSFPQIIVGYESFLIGLISNHHANQSEIFKILFQILRLEIDENLNEKENEMALGAFIENFENRGVFNSKITEEAELEVGLEFLDLFINLSVRIDVSKLKNLLHWLSPAAGASNSTIRSNYLAHLTQIYKHEAEFGSLKHFIEEIFTKQLLDNKIFATTTDENIMKIVTEFWADYLQEFTSFQKLFLILVERFGKIQHSASIIIDLLFIKMSSSDDFNRRIFLEILPQDDFKVYKIMDSKNSPANLGAGYLKLKSNVLNAQETVSSDMKNNPLTAETDPLTSLRSKFHTNLFKNNEKSGGESDFELFEFDNSYLAQFIHPKTQIQSIVSKNNDIKLVRKYRIGKFPDIMIKNSDILSPLSSLSKADDKICSAFLTAILTSVLNSINEVGEREKFLKNLRKNLFKILPQEETMLQPAKTKLFFSIALPILQILYSFKINIPSTYLELVKKQKFDDENMNDGPRAKKLRFNSSADCDQKEIWLKIGNIYKELHEVESLGRLGNTTYKR